MRLAGVNPIPSLFTIAPANRDHEVGLRCAFSVFVPLILLLVLDRVDLAVFASFGAFTAIHGRNQPHGLRLRSQLCGAGLMVAVLLAGTLVARAGWADTTRSWALVAWATMVAGVCAVLAVYWDQRPAGSLVHIIAFAAVASVPYQPSLGRALRTAVLMVAFSVLVGMSSRSCRPGVLRSSGRSTNRCRRAGGG